MKFAIRYADKIVGVFIILAVGIIIFVVLMLGSSQRWFSRDYNFKTYFNSADGLGQNMAVQYKGFTIGRVKTVKLAEDDRVEVHFTIFDTYIDRVKEGSLVDIQVSPIGLGNKFVFYPGRGRELIKEWEIIPTINSPEAKQLLADGLVVLPENDDGISNLMNQVGTLLTTLNIALADVQEAIEGSDRISLGRTLGNVEILTQTLSGNIDHILDEIIAQLNPILENLSALSTDLASPDGTVMSILDSEGPVYADLTSSLNAVSGILLNLEKTSGFIPAQLPVLLTELHSVLKQVDDVLVSVSNNPLLKGGVPEHKETPAGGMHSRDLEF
ncbi:MAG: MlaD family protein [Treponema sp.]|jgi:phospholipid/cholesterol/gamma-HCH transport system substrate-binding protein|nr:MlaD family protein [Treponema sp.]